MDSTFKYSEGEKSIQKSAGVEQLADRLTTMVKRFVPKNGMGFIQDQLLFFISSVSENGMLWTSMIRGKNQGFVQFLSEEQIEIKFSDIDWIRNDILYENLKHSRNVGLLFIEFSNRRRFRINGYVELKKDKILIQVLQAFPNCPKYIQARNIVESQSTQEISKPIQLGLEEIREVVQKADTFIMGTQGKNGEVDCSHRGGMPGFLKFTDNRTIKIPDYSGNNMFTSLGNIKENPNTGMLFIDFIQGATLQLSGKARLALEEQDPQNGIERFWYFEIDSNIYTNNALPLEWSMPNYSPFNPELR